MLANNVSGLNTEQEKDMVVILFTTELPSRFTDALEAEGLEVYEALAISEVFALAEQHQSFSIIITPEVD
jgi:hypothetical protein